MVRKENDLDLEKLIEDIKKWRPSAREIKATGEFAFVFAPSDQQIGKKGSGGGTLESVARIHQTKNDETFGGSYAYGSFATEVEMQLWIDAKVPSVQKIYAKKFAEKAVA